MSRRDFNAIDAEVLLRLANRTDITSNMRSAFIADAYLTISMLFRHKEIELFATETVTIGADSLTPAATDIWFPTFLRNVTDGYPLRLDSQEKIERAQTKPTSRPYTYYWYGGVFYFESFADTEKSLKIWYKRKPTEFSGTSTSELDQLFDPLIIMEAARMGLETVRDFDEAEKQEAAFNRYAVKKKLPVDQAKLNDYRQGFRVKFH